MAARAGPAGADVPGPALVGASLLSPDQAAHFLHLAGQALPVCAATKQARTTGDALRFSETLDRRGYISSSGVKAVTKIRDCTFRCLIEAWALLRQHSNHLNMSELMGFLYESCQELGLIKELLKLPLGLGEQVRHTHTQNSTS